MAHLSLFRRLARNEKGVALVEFAMLLPILVLLLGLTFESARIMWSYQSTIAGVRDASRYLGRMAPSNVCTAGGSLAGYNAQLLDIVTNRLGSTNSVMPSGVTVTAVTSSLTCLAGTYRVSPAPVATVNASVTITLPF
ncbi:TadE/TadG family type IV pilus assembly protein, partial [Rubellimicrobium roseum]